MNHPVLLYDGNCGFCDSTVKFVLRHDRRGTLRFAPLQGAYGTEVRARHPALANVDSVLWVERINGTERVLVRSDAALRLAKYLGGFWHLARVGAVLPRVVRDFCYDAFAKRRYRWFGKVDACELPDASVRARFVLDSV